jgi:hypothetical protein
VFIVLAINGVNGSSLGDAIGLVLLMVLMVEKKNANMQNIPRVTQ